LDFVPFAVKSFLLTAKYAKKKRANSAVEKYNRKERKETEKMPIKVGRTP